MINLIKRGGIIILFIFCLSSLSFSQEQLTITTYYPSPYGSYRDLKVTNTLEVGDVDTTLTPNTKINARNTDDIALDVTRYAIVGESWENQQADNFVRGALGWARSINLLIGSVTYRAGVYGQATLGNWRYAGYFDGDVVINGELLWNHAGEGLN